MFSEDLSCIFDLMGNFKEGEHFAVNLKERGYYLQKVNIRIIWALEQSFIKHHVS